MRDTSNSSGIGDDVFKEANARRRFVRRMFDGIAGTYDLLNHLLSAGMDIRWRRSAVALLGPQPEWRVLDLATGTGDLGMETAEVGASVIGADLSVPMMREGVGKTGPVLDADSNPVRFLCGDGECLPFADASFNGVTVGFGVRNFGDLDAGLREMLRVLCPGGRAVILEFSRPRAIGLRQLYGLYFRYLLPQIGRIVSGDPAAYRYLYESVMRFPEGGAFVQRMAAVGFTAAAERRLTIGIATLYVGTKPG